MEESIGDLVTALAKAREEFKPVKKNRTANTGKFSYHYADLADIIDATAPALSKHQLVVLQLLGGTADQPSVTTVLAHASGQQVSSTVSLAIEDSGRMTDAQAMGAAITYLRRYAYSAIIGVVADEDTDAAAPAVKQVGKMEKTDPAADKLVQEISRLVKKKQSDGIMSDDQRAGYRKEVGAARNDPKALAGIKKRIEALGRQVVEPDDKADIDATADEGWDPAADAQQEIPLH